MSTTVLFTGGLNSTVAAYETLGYDDVNALVYVQYGPQNAGERNAARTIASKLGVPLHTPKMYAGGVEKALHRIHSGRAEHNGPDGPWDPEIRHAWDIPGVHLAMIGIAGTIAAANGSDSVTIGITAETQHAFSAGTREFLNAASYALGASAGDHLKRGAVISPIIYSPGAHVIRLGYTYGAPLEDTWSCLRARPIHCGTCPGCVARHKAFTDFYNEATEKERASFGLDPTKYATTPTG